MGELSKRSGVNIETIRYYERVEMLAPPPRTAGGRRVYDTTDLRILVSFDARASWVSRLMKSAPYCARSGLTRLRVARSARSQRATSKTFGPN
jgi:MerR family regulatory protein